MVTFDLVILIVQKTRLCQWTSIVKASLRTLIPSLPFQSAMDTFMDHYVTFDFLFSQWLESFLSVTYWLTGLGLVFSFLKNKIFFLIANILKVLVKERSKLK